MGVIITHSPPATGSGGGSGAFSQADKLAIEMEMEFKTAYTSYYKEFDYFAAPPQLKGSLSDIDIWTDSGKGTKLFHKDLFYNSDYLLEKSLLIRVSDGSGLVKEFGYDAQDNLISLTVSAG